MIRVFPRKTSWTPTDELAFIGDPPIIGRPPEQPVAVSCTFTWDIPEAERLYRAWSEYYSGVELGGPALDDPGAGFQPGLFLKDGIAITSRGCSKNCEWCFVPKREGQIRELEIRPGWNINDNNLLACSMGHIKKVFDMLRKQKKAAVFSGGLDAELMTEQHVELLRSIRVSEMWFACDYPGAIRNLEKVAALLPDFTPRKKRCYVLIGHNGESPRQAEKRLETVYNMGFWPLAMLYQSANIKRAWVSKEWQDLRRLWSRPAAFKAVMAAKGGEGAQK